ncbi:MAG: hypothetical protein ACOZAN_05045 [Patescibacteria group bacterium]
MKDKSVAKPTGKLIRKIGQFLVKSWSAFQGGQKLGKMRADLEEFQTRAGVQKVDRNRMEGVHRRFTETSPDFEGLSLKTLRYCDGEVTVVFDHSFVLFPRIAQYIRKSPVQFDIPSSYLYGVVLKKLCL